MKTRLVRITAVVLVLAMMPLWLFGCGKLDSKVEAKLVEMMIGDGSLSTKEDIGANYINELDAAVTNLKSKFVSGTWPESIITGSESVRTQHFKNLYTITKAWATKKSSFYHDRDILKMINQALDYGMTIYGDGQRAEREYSITIMERCDSAEYLIRSLLILHDSGKVKSKDIPDLLAAVYYKFPTAYGDSVDLIRTSYIALGSAVLRGESDRISQIVADYLINVVGVVASGNGLYADGSYITYDKTASTGSYGVMGFSTLVEMAYAVSGTDADFADPAAVADFLYYWGRSSVIPSLFNGSAFVGTVGSYVDDADALGGRAVSALIGLTELLDETKGNEIKSIVKAYGESSNTAFIGGLSSYGACELQKIVKDEKITAAPVTGAFSFSEMDKVTVLGNKYSASLSLSSYRSAKYETRVIYPESLKETDGAVNGNGWYTGDSMLIIYTDDYKIPSNYWTYVNGQRLPGTTVDSRNRTPDDNGGFNGVNSNAGAVTLDAFAVSSYDFVNNNAELRSDLTAKKSVFFFGNKIVSLGAGIKNTYEDNTVLSPNKQTIESIIENVYYGTNNSVPTSPDADGDIQLAAGRETVMPEAFYVMRYGGIYVPADKNDVLNARLNATDGGNFLEIWLDHGKLPENASYEYVIIPSTSMKMNAFFEFVAAPDYTVLSNTDKVQAVADGDSGVTGYTFWEGAECNGIKTDFACNMIVKETDNEITIAISDFTHFGAGNTTGGTITLSGSYSLKSADTGLSYSGNTITVDRSVASNGQTLTIVLSK